MDDETKIRRSASNKAWYERNKDRVRDKRNAKEAAWRLANLEIARERGRRNNAAYRARHPGIKAEASAKWRVNNPELFALSVSRQTAKRIAKQEKFAGRRKPKRCDVCKKVTVGRSLHFDHCHINGHFRGWLCYKCNSVLGYVNDSPELLERLAAYLKATCIAKKVV
jgi:hypothetical protein